jgi:hypothetical protein
MSPFGAHILSPKKAQSQTVIREELHNSLLYEKFASKMLMKLTPDSLNRCRQSTIDIGGRGEDIVDTVERT